MDALTLDTALALAQGTLRAGRARGLSPLTAAVLDVGGHVVALLRDDGASLLRPQIAVGKAWGCLGMGFGGRELSERAARMPAFFNALSDMSRGRMVPVPGGVLLSSRGGTLLGAIGVSGDSSDNDELCALEAISAAGLIPKTGA